MSFSLLFVSARMMSASDYTEQQLKWLGFQQGRITRVPGCGQSKKLMPGIKEIYSERRITDINLPHAHALAGHEPDDHTQRSQDRDKINRGDAAGMSRQISGEECLICCAEGHQKEEILSQHQP